MREALRSRSTLLLVAALLAGGAGGFALGRATDESATTVAGQSSARVPALRDFIRRHVEVGERPPPTTIEAPAALREALNEGRIHEDQDPDTYPPDVKQAIREYEAQKKAQ